MEREINPRADARSLTQLIRLLAHEKPDVVNASTPKAGLLGMIAARATRVPVRVYLVRGLRLETERGARRRILASTERVASTCATHVVCNSPSLEAAYRALRLAPPSRYAQLGVQSSNGVDTARFDAAALAAEDALAVRRLAIELGIPQDARVLGFVGRPVRDKGIADLLEALRTTPALRDAWCLVVGASFSGDTDDALVRELRARPRTVVVAAVRDVRPYYALMRVLAFPSHREGMPNVVLEAAAMQVPAVGFEVTGVRDAIAAEQTGTLVPPRDTRAFGAALAAYLDDAMRRVAHGRAARARVVRDFSHERVCEAWADFYAGLAPNTLSARAR